MFPPQQQELVEAVRKQQELLEEIREKDSIIQALQQTKQRQENEYKKLRDECDGLEKKTKDLTVSSRVDSCCW